MYNECIQLTRQFAFCPNAFRVDLYKGCDFGCKYCFANMNWTQYGKSNHDTANINKIKRIFNTALETDKASKDILVELVRHRVPIHCGGMSDPFQKREWELNLTKQLIELSNSYDYPIQFSTKTSKMPDDYMEILNPDIHAFQVSILGYDDDYIKCWECNTSTAQERLDFVDYLINRGFWCGIRIQPIINISQVEKLCYNINNASYVTVEHFKSIFDVKGAMLAFLNQVENKHDYEMSKGKLQFKRDVKIKNIKTIKNILNAKNIKVGVGDNDLHYMSDSRCCCGIDTIGESFNNYLKYNLTYMCTGDFNADLFIPQCNPRKHINDQKYGLKIDCKQYVDDYIQAHPDYLGNKRSNVEKHLFGVSNKSLF